MRKLRLLILTIWYLSVLCIQNVVSEMPECFRVESDSCEQLSKNGTKCGTKSDSSTSQIFCCNITSEREVLDYVKAQPIDKELSGFHIRDSNISNLNVNNLFDNLKELVTLSFTNSRIDRFSGWFKENINLICLNISENSISEIPPHLILDLKGLRNIVITNNTNITMLPLLPNIRNFKLDLSGNEDLSCKYLINLTEVIYRKNIDLNQVKKNVTVCVPEDKWTNFYSRTLISMTQIDPVKEIFRNCPDVGGKENCTCSVHALDRTQDSYVYQALVDCSFKNMTSLPETLPPNTKVLNIRNNRITSFEGIGNSTYGGIKELLADYNNITSLKQLEGTAFLHSFQNLTLTYNKIEEMSEYHILSNVFDRNAGRLLLLAKNVFKCNCATASTTKTWLLSNTAHIPDYREVETICEGTLMKVVEMTNSNKLCSSPRELKDYLKYVIIAEITLFVLMIGKVSYDYYVFKTAGYLPWPASKMPKLPCDWCFET